MKKALLAVLAGALALGGLTACSEIAPPDEVGLWYAQGQIDGNTFDHCVKPGVVDETSWNDSVYWVPNSLRTWNAAAKEAPSVDTTTPLTLTAKPATGQSSGLEVNVYTQTNFMLNTFCGADERDKSSPLVQWWEKIGKRYGADTDEGWLAMLNATVVPALEKAKNTLRSYSADELVLGNVWSDAEKVFSAAFSTELERLSGGDFFCGPSFNRAVNECAPVAVSIKDVDYTDPKIQQARSEKQAAVERAQAQVAEAEGNAKAAIAEAEGKLKAAQAQQALYGNAAWLQLEMAKLELERAKACAAATNCTIVLSTDGAQIHVGGR